MKVTESKTIFARYQDVKGGKNFDINGDDISNVERDFRKYADVQIRSSVGTFRDFGDVLSDLSKKWNTLSQAEQSGIAKALAGTRQRENFLILMNNMSTALDLQAKQADSSGNALVRYQTYAESTQAKLADLQQTAQKMWMNLISSDTINGVVGTLTQLVASLDTLISKFGLLGTALYILVPIIGIKFALAVRTATLELVQQQLAAKNSVNAFGLLGQGLSVAVGRMLGLETASTGATASVVALNLATGALTLGLTLIPMLIAGIMSKNEQARQQEQQLAEERKQNLATIQEDTEKSMASIDELNKLLAEQKTIMDKNSDKQTADEKQRLHDIEVKLAQVVPDATTSYDKQNQALAENYDLTAKLVKMKKEEANSKALEVVSSVDADKTYESLKRQKEMMSDIENLLGETDKNSYNKNFIDFFNKYSSDFDNYDANFRKGIGKNGGENDMQLLAELHSKLSQSYNDETNTLNKYNNAAEWYNELGKKQFKTIEDESMGIGKNTDEVKTNTTAVQDNSNAVQDNADSVDGLGDSASNAQSAYDNLGKELKSLNQIIADQNNQQGMSADQVLDLITKYPQLQNAITLTANGYMVEKGALETLRQAKIAEMNTTLDAQANNAKATLQSAQSQLSAFGIIIEGIKTLQDAQVAASRISTTYQLIQAGLPPMLAAKQQAENDALRGQIIDYGNLLNRINTLKGLASNPSYGVSNYYSGSSSASKAAEDAAKKAEQAQQDAYSAIDDINGKLMEAIKVQVEEEKKALDERLNNYKNFIDDKLKALDDEYSAEDRKRKLDDENKKKADLQAQRDALLADSSDEAKSLRNSLQEQIDAQQQVIDDLNRDYSREDQKANLNKQLADFEKQINDQKSALDEKYSDEEVAKLAKNGLLKGLVSIGTQSMSVKDLLLEAMQKSGEAFTATGQKLQTELIDKLVKVQQLMQNMNGDGTISGNVALNVLGSHADGGKIYQQGLYELHPNEWVVNSTQGNILDKIVKNDYSFLRNFKVDIPNIPAMNTNSSGGIQIGSIIETVQGNVDRTTLPMLEKIIKDNLPQVVAEARMNSDKKLGTYNARVK